MNAGESNIKFIRVDLLKHIEGYSKKRVQTIKRKILSDGIWRKAICIEQNHLLVLDGQHRLEVAKELGFNFIPCELFDYEDVEVWSLRKTEKVSRKLVIERSLAGNIYPYKTAKHKFPRKIEECSISFEEIK